MESKAENSMIKKKKKKTIMKKLRPPQWDKVWLVDEIKEIKSLQMATLAEVKDAGPNKNISPELEAQVNRASLLSRNLDRKVPDKNVPPGQVNNQTKRK